MNGGRNVADIVTRAAQVGDLRLHTAGQLAAMTAGSLEERLSLYYTLAETPGYTEDGSWFHWATQKWIQELALNATIINAWPDPMLSAAQRAQMIIVQLEERLDRRLDRALTEAARDDLRASLIAALRPPQLNNGQLGELGRAAVRLATIAVPMAQAKQRLHLMERPALDILERRLLREAMDFERAEGHEARALAVTIISAALANWLSTIHEVRGVLIEEATILYDGMMARLVNGEMG